jgi:CrcB protein
VEREKTSTSRPGRAPRQSRSPRLDRQELVAVFAGGCVGAVVRSALAEGLNPAPGTWPWPTFAVNVVGALLLGYFVTRLSERLAPTAYRRSFLASGVCGALTTFSTMMVEVVRMLEGSHWTLAVSYCAASIAAGLAGVFLATKAVRRARLAW